MQRRGGLTTPRFNRTIVGLNHITNQKEKDMKTHYIYKHIDDAISHNADSNILAKDVSEMLYPDEPEFQITEVEIYEDSDSLYIEGEHVELIEESELFSILLSHDYDLSRWEYIKTENQGNNYRAIFHKIPRL